MRSLHSNISCWSAWLGIGLGTCAASWLIHRLLVKRRNGKSEQWMHIGHLQEIDIYPLKSAAAVELQEALVTSLGLQYGGFQDRQLIILNDEGKVGFAGAYPLMLSIKSRLLSDNCIELSAAALKTLQLNLSEIIANGAVHKKSLKGYALTLSECSAECHEWISQAVLSRKEGLRLFVVQNYTFSKFAQLMGKCDYVPIMVLHDKSIDDLNARLLPENAVHHQQFRGNFLIKSLKHIESFAEDKWLRLKIGKSDKQSVVLRYTAPCLRCILPNIDINTFERNADFEPLRTLKKYRLRSNAEEPEMGVYFTTQKTGSIQIGDPVYVQYK